MKKESTCIGSLKKMLVYKLHNHTRADVHVITVSMNTTLNKEISIVAKNPPLWYYDFYFKQQIPNDQL